MDDLAPGILAAREAAPAQLEPTFAEKVEAFREARRALEKVYAVTDEQLKALGLPPPIPGELFVTFSHPEKQGKASPSEDGWTAEELRWIAKGNVPPGRPVWLHWLRPDDPICKRAAELIPVREAHDARWEEWVRMVLPEGLARFPAPNRVAGEGLGFAMRAARYAASRVSLNRPA